MLRTLINYFFNLLVYIGGKSVDDLIGFFETIAKLKKEKRKGWLVKGVKDCESVADHSQQLSAMALFFAKKLGLDECKAVKMAVVHDLPEAICGDYAVRVNEKNQEVTSNEKKQKEQQALEQLCGMLDSENATELKGLWEEYEKRESKEARLVYELDRLEAIFQALEYEKQGNFEVGLEEFYEYADARIRIPAVREVFERLMEGRKTQKAPRKH